MIVRFDTPPLIPGGDEAREWAERELQRPEYQAAEPTPIDRIARAVWDWITGLFNGPAPDALGGLFIPVLVAIIIAIVVIAFIVWGRPSAVRRAAPTFAPLFGDDDTRSAAQLRAAAAAAAAAGDWHEAIVVRQRAAARGLQERGIVDPPPGATVHAFARATRAPFPGLAELTTNAADTFDDVRYLRRPATAEGYAIVAAADDALVAAKPERDALIGASAA